MELNVAVAVQTVVWLVGISVGLVVAITNGTKVWRYLGFGAVSQDTENTVTDPGIAKLASTFIPAFLCCMDVSMSILFGVWVLCSIKLWWVDDDSKEDHVNRTCLPLNLKLLNQFFFMIIGSGVLVFIRCDNIYGDWKTMTHAGLFGPTDNRFQTATRCGCITKVISGYIVSGLSTTVSTVCYAICGVVTLLSFLFMCSSLSEIAPKGWAFCFEYREVHYPITGCILLTAAILALTIGYAGHKCQTSICKIYSRKKVSLMPLPGDKMTPGYSVQSIDSSGISETTEQGFQLRQDQLAAVDFKYRIRRIIHNVFVPLIPWLPIILYLVCFELPLQFYHVKGMAHFVVWVSSCLTCLWYFVFYQLSPSYVY